MRRRRTSAYVGIISLGATVCKFDKIDEVKVHALFQRFDISHSPLSRKALFPGKLKRWRENPESEASSINPEATKRCCGYGFASPRKLNLGASNSF